MKTSHLPADEVAAYFSYLSAIALDAGGPGLHHLYTTSMRELKLLKPEPVALTLAEYCSLASKSMSVRASTTGSSGTTFEGALARHQKLSSTPSIQNARHTSGLQLDGCHCKKPLYSQPVFTPLKQGE